MKNNKWRNNNLIKKLSSYSFYTILRASILASLVVMLFILTGYEIKFNPDATIYMFVLAGALLVSTIIKFYLLQKSRIRFVLYVFDVLVMLGMLVLSSSSYVVTVYILILSEYYYSATSRYSRTIMGISSFLSYAVCFVLVTSLSPTRSFDVQRIVSQLTNDLIFFAIHFTIFNLTIALFKRNKIIEKNLEELQEVNDKLQKAYKKLEEVTVLEERNRISKEIHDVVGHSITTIIAQTEAGKLLIDNNPAEAKEKLIYSNILAKDALQELRNSVHNLSAREVDVPLRSAIKNILESFGSSCDINIRYDVDDISLEKEVEIFIISSLKEGLSNGLRHGKSTAFYFELKQIDNTLQFVLTDNGKCDEENIVEGFGLSKMRQQAEKLGGKINFSAEKDEGFEIKLILPLKKK